ncbi:DUF6090 family protein [Muriicola sp. Z0-33]|uniref:DUF6090 family protein n=1 Tax=Muriicola sp. Z0-33 TaxID=2816957 RepID=UPI0022387571|nr:DUF6090 family protein [Muriicola sp. Z0-33]MCW5516479.1 hypothetical protein [Muriicola sp. Z0-33]
MLRFFRQIRQRLLTDNKFSKYLLYAVGEILLVVIGILIALQVNNWNQEKQEHIDELKFLSRLREDIMVDNAYYNRRIYDASLFIEWSDEFLYCLFEKQQSLAEAESIWKLFQYFDSSEMMTIQNSTFSEMLYAGKLELITNPELKSLLLDYYRKSEEAAKHVAEFNEYTVDVLNIMVDKAPNIYIMNTYLEKTNYGIEEEFGYLNDPTSDAFKAITYAAGLYGTKHKVFRDNYFKELEKLSKELINRIEAYE